MQGYVFENDKLTEEGTFSMIIEGVKDVNVKGNDRTVVNFVVLGGECDGLVYSKFLNKENIYDKRFLYMLGIACGVLQATITERGISPEDFVGERVVIELKKNKDGYLNVIKIEKEGEHD